MNNQKPASVNDLIAWQSSHRKRDDESVGKFLNRRLVSYAASLTEEPHVAPQTIVATCKLTGDDPIHLIFAQTDHAMTWDDPFKSHFLDDARSWLTETGLDELMGQLERHRDSVNDDRLLMQAALDGLLRLVDDGSNGQIAVVRLPTEGIRPS